MKNFKFTYLLLTSVCFCWLECAIAGAANLPLVNNDLLGGWRFFGNGLVDTGADLQNNEWFIEVDWRQSTWGIGGMFTLPEVIDGRKLQAVRIRVRTKYGSKPLAYAGIATANDANLIVPIHQAKEVGERWQIIDFSRSQMINAKPEQTSANFSENDWNKIKIIKILFAKPEDQTYVNDELLISQPELIFADPPVPSTSSGTAPLLSSNTTVNAKPAVSVSAGKSQSGAPAQTRIEGQWFTLGNGISSLHIDVASKQIRMGVDWQQASWGVGIMYLCQKPLDATQLKSLHVSLATVNNSQTKAVFAIAAEDGAGMSTPPESAIPINAQNQSIIFPCSVMIKDATAEATREFTDQDWSAVQLLKILFSKPENVAAATDETIIINNPQLHFTGVDAMGGTKDQVFDLVLPKPKIDDAMLQQLYQETIEVAETARQQSRPTLEISNIYFKGAENLRDLGDSERTIKLFESAIREDPNNAYPLLTYGDYLMGYRGLYEYANAKYEKADTLYQADPNAYDDVFKQNLARSVQIMHRDGQDGVPLLQTKPLSIYWEPFVAYKRSSIHPLELYDNQLRVEDVIQKQFLGLDNAITFFTNQRDQSNNQSEFDMAQERVDHFTDLKHKAQKQFSKIKTDLPRRRYEHDYGSIILFRSSNPNFPYLKLTLNTVEIETLNINPEDLNHPLDGKFHGQDVVVGKNFILDHDLDLNVEAGIGDRKIESRNFQQNIDIAQVDADVYYIDGRLTKSFGTNTLKLTLGTGWSDINRQEGFNLMDRYEDFLFELRGKLRLSVYKKPTESENSARFRGRRSDHYEIGLTRIKANYDRFGEIRQYLPYVSYEMFGLMKGYLDFTFAYNAIYFEKSEVDAHRIKFIPALIPAYQLYANDFTHGLEFLSFDFPLDATWGEEGTAYHSYGAGINCNGIYSTPWNVRFFPKIGFDYRFYPHLDRDDWGITAEIKMRY